MVLTAAASHGLCVVAMPKRDGAFLFADVMTEGEERDKGGRWDLINSVILVYLDAGQVLRVASSTQ